MASASQIMPDLLASVVIPKVLFILAPSAVKDEPTGCPKPLVEALNVEYGGILNPTKALFVVPSVNPNDFPSPLHRPE